MSREDDPAVLEAEIVTTEAAVNAAQAEAARLAAAADLELDDERAEELARQARGQHRAARRAELGLPELRVRHAEALWRTKRTAFTRHQQALAASARQLMKLLPEVAAANVAAVRAFEAASAELGADVAELTLGRWHWMGLCFPDLVAAWCRETERRLTALDRAELPRPRQEPPPPVARRLPVTVEEASPGQFGDRISLNPGQHVPVSAPAPAPAPAPAKSAVADPRPAAVPRPAPRALRRDTASEGQRLVRILRTGVDIDGFQGVADDLIAVQVDLADQLVRGGAADFEEASNT
jgi:hypothetical protein